jgi:hypothetical protein
MFFRYMFIFVTITFHSLLLEGTVSFSDTVKGYSMKETRTIILYFLFSLHGFNSFLQFISAQAVSVVYTEMWGVMPREKTWSIEEKSQGETRLSHSTPTTTCVVTENPDIQRRQIYRAVGDCKILPDVKGKL